MGLGGLQDVGLAQARRKAADARKLLDECIDPIRHRNSKKAEAKAGAMTLVQRFTDTCVGFLLPSF